MATVDQAIDVLNGLVRELAYRQKNHGACYGVDTLSKAYDGEFNLHYASEDFKDYFARRYADFSDNWCGIVADAPHERLEVTGIRLRGEPGGDDALWQSWLENDADELSDLAMLDAIIAKRAFALVWGDADDNPRITWEHPSQCVVAYDPETRARTAGAKVWRDDKLEYATLYLPNEVWKFQRDCGSAVLRDAGFEVVGEYEVGGGNWVPRGDEPMLRNPMGKVPLVELANRPRLAGEPKSDIAGTLAMQHAINLLWSYLFAVSDEATIGQRLILGAEKPVVPVLNSDGDVIGEKPVDLRKMRRDNVLWIEDPSARIGEWKPANLEVFTDIIEIAVGHIAAQTRTPAHYLMIGDVANVSEGAMKALETGLVQRTREKTQHFGRAIRDVFELVALVQGDDAKAAAVRTGKVLWKDVENRSDAQLADALQKKQAIGYPLEYLLELDGLPPTEIERVLAMREREQADLLTRAVVDGVNRDAANPDVSA